jgi:hypothetical protein
VKGLTWKTLCNVWSMWVTRAACWSRLDATPCSMGWPACISLRAALVSRSGIAVALVGLQCSLRQLLSSCREASSASRSSVRQGASQVLCLGTGISCKVLSLSAKAEVPWCEGTRGKRLQSNYVPTYCHLVSRSVSRSVSKFLALVHTFTPALVLR